MANGPSQTVINFAPGHWARGLASVQDSVVAFKSLQIQENDNRLESPSPFFGQYLEVGCISVQLSVPGFPQTFLTSQTSQIAIAAAPAKSVIIIKLSTVGSKEV